MANYSEEIQEENPIDYLNYFVNSKINFNKSNPDIFNFEGELELVDIKIKLSIENFMQRGSILKNTEFIYGVVIYTGHNTKIMQQKVFNKKEKRSLI